MPALHRVELFERETIRLGDPLRSPTGLTVRFGTTELEALLRFNDVTRQRYFVSGYKQITARHHVGYVEVGKLAIEILPKADREVAGGADTRPWRDALLQMIRAATDIRLDSPDVASLRAGRSTLVDLVAVRFVAEVERLLREGLGKGYRDDEGNSATFRGRLLVSQNLRENVTRGDRFYVRYSTYDHNTPMNRILRKALDVLAARGLSPGTLASVTACRSRFPDVGPCPTHPGMFDRIPVGRSTARYQSALALARLILEQQAPELRAGSAPVFAVLFDMELLWERYIAAVFRKVAGDRWVVGTQQSKRFWSCGSTTRTVRPDIIVTDAVTRRVLFVADTKWQVVDDGSPGDDHLKQMFVYNEVFGAPCAVLIYPTAGSSRGLEGAYAIRSHSCWTAHIGMMDGGTWNSELLAKQVKSLLLRVAESSDVAA